MRLPASALALAAIAVPLLACGGPVTTGGPDAAAVDGPPTDAGPVGPSLATCEDPVDSPTRVTYYVAINQPGADNVACDGLAPTDEGGGHCPFRDFTSLRVRELLFQGPNGFGVKAVTMLVRDGIYQIEPIDAHPGEPPIPLWIYGAGTSAAEAVVLAAYPGEHPVLDGTCDDQRPECQRAEDPNRIGTLLYLWGTWERLEGMTIQNVHHWNVTVSGDHTCIQDNELIGPHGSDSDSIKSFNGSGPAVIVRRNDMHDFAEQLIDATASTEWLITDNDFHDATKGVGFKFEARGSVVRGNRFWNLEREAVSFGAAGSSDHDLRYEAFDLLAEGNHIRDTGMAVQVSYCDGCTIRDNLIDRTVVGVLAIDQGLSGCGGGGCLPTTGLVIEDNVFRDLIGNMDAPPDTFVAIDPVRVADFTAGANLYCVAAGHTERFFYGGMTPLQFPAWVSGTGTDSTSRIGDRASQECSITFRAP